MELWIRSQDRDSLIKTKKIELVYDYLCSDDIQLVHIDTNEGRIASYKTKERALAVLDEIQELIKPKIITTQYQCQIKDTKKTEFDLIMNPVKTEIQELSTYIYEMPNE